MKKARTKSGASFAFQRRQSFTHLRDRKLWMRVAAEYCQRVRNANHFFSVKFELKCLLFHTADRVGGGSSTRKCTAKECQTRHMLWEASKLRSSPAGIVIAAHMDSDNMINDMSLSSTGSTGVRRNLMGALPAL